MALFFSCQGTKKSAGSFQPSAQKIEMNYACLKDTLPLVIVNSNEEYQKLHDFFQNSGDGCVVKLPEISLDTLSLVLFRMNSGGCEIGSSFNTSLDNMSRSVNFLITVEQEGFCKKLHLVSGMYVVRKPSKNYKVEAEIVKKEPGQDRIFPGI